MVDLASPTSHSRFCFCCVGAVLQYFEGLSPSAIVEKIDRRLDALRQELIEEATSAKASLKKLHQEEQILQV